jgi:hypothetical protein
LKVSIGFDELVLQTKSLLFILYPYTPMLLLLCCVIGLRNGVHRQQRNEPRRQTPSSLANERTKSPLFNATTSPIIIIVILNVTINLIVGCDIRAPLVLKIAVMPPPV